MNLENLSEEEMVKQVSEATGIPFKYKDSLFGWVHNIKKTKEEFSIRYGNYSIGDHRRMIHCDYCKGTSGCGGPRDSVEEAIEFFMRRINNE